MQKFRRKPTVLEAVKWRGSNFAEVIEFLKITSATGGVAGEDAVTRINDKIKINTLEGTMTADVGDWILRGTAGEIYPCKPDIFKNIYEPVEEDDGLGTKA